jgi:E3 ubiquitin-protein ligase listerin
LLDSFLTDATIDALIELWQSLPIELGQRVKSAPCSVRSYFCDSHNWVTSILCAALNSAIGAPSCSSALAGVYPHMRFLSYSESGAVLAPHVDLSRCDANTGRRSTHSFLLYLTDCDQGGETALLGAVSGEQRSLILASVKPKRGRLLVFPHRCPHEGLKVEDVPKLLIRGEVWLSEHARVRL